jgi:hypothetical protein
VQTSQLLARIAALEAAQQASRAQLASAQQAWEARFAAQSEELERAQSAARTSDAAHAAQLADAEARAAALAEQLSATRRAAAHAIAEVSIKRERAEDAEAAAAAAVLEKDKTAAALQRMQRDVARSAHSAVVFNAETHATARVKREEAEHAAAAEGTATAAAQALRQELFDATVCIVCCDAKRDMLFFGCGHLVCSNCGPRLESCPWKCDVEKVRGGAAKSLRPKMRSKPTEPLRVFI